MNKMTDTAEQFFVQAYEEISAFIEEAYNVKLKLKPEKIFKNISENAGKQYVYWLEEGLRREVNLQLNVKDIAKKKVIAEKMIDIFTKIYNE
jgi:hypothetical protein